MEYIYGIEIPDQNKEVVNPAYSRLYQQRKKLIEKRRRLEAQMLEAMENNITQSTNETNKWRKNKPPSKKK